MTATLPDPPELDPAELAGHGFSRTRRGFEPVEVHSTLGRAADALRAWSIRDEHLRERIADLEARLNESAELDEDRITKVLGEETARIVSAARDAAAEIRTKATDQAARLLSETEAEASAAAAELTGAAQKDRDDAASTLESARAEAQQLRDDAAAAAASLDSAARERHDALIAEADAVLAAKVSEAEAAASGITETAEAELSMARAEGERVRADAAAAAEKILDSARADGRAMLDEAKQVRERVLRDLAERRRTARRQIEAARAGRDEIVELLRAACGEATATVESLVAIDDQVQRAADGAALGVDADIDREVAELEATMMAVPEPDEGHVVVSSTHIETDIVTEEVVDGDVVDVETVHLEDDLITVAVEDPAVEDPGVEDPAVVEVAVEDSGIVEAAVEEAAVHRIETVSVRPDEATPDDADAVEQGDLGGDGDDASDESAHGVDGEDEESGATVHDLFARLRAEGLDPEQGDEDSTDPGTAGSGEAEPAAAESIDLTARRSADSAERAATAQPSPTVESGTDAAAVQSDSSETDDAHEGAGSHVTTIVAEDPGQQLLDRRDELLLPVEKAMGRLLKRLVSDEQNEILDRLRRVKRGRPDADTVLPAVDDGVDAFTDALLGEFTESVDAGSLFWQELSGTTADALFADDDDLRSTLAGAVRDFLELHRAHLDRTFAESDEAGLDVSELGDLIRSSYRDLRSSSLADFAGDLLTLGFALGERRAAGPDAQWRWVVDNGGLPCADGEDNALAGAIGCGEEFPTGDVTPPAHPGCRCVLAPAHR